MDDEVSDTTSTLGAACLSRCLAMITRPIAATHATMLVEQLSDGHKLPSSFGIQKFKSSTELTLELEAGVSLPNHRKLVVPWR